MRVNVSEANTHLDDLAYPIQQRRLAHTDTPRPLLWRDIPDEQWDDWRWQLSHRLNSADQLAQ